MWWSYKPYVPVAQRRANAAKEIKKLRSKGRKIQPVLIDGKTIARTFWGKAWCDNLESYSDFETRLPRGRTYVRNGSVCDLHVEPGRVTALVCGSELYKINIAIDPLSPETWAQIKRQCAGQISSVIELLQGKLSQNVMEIITRPAGGLFPKPQEIQLGCSCPDWADMCKHVAAALYGIGARLDDQPELLFLLRKVDHLELIQQAADVKLFTSRKRAVKTIAANALGDVFGIDLEPQAPPTSPQLAPAPSASPKPARSYRAKLPTQPKHAPESHASVKTPPTNAPPKRRRSRQSAR